MIAIATKRITQDACSDSPAYLFAEKGQELLVIEDLTKCNNLPDYKKDYAFVCQDIKKRYGTFYVKKCEVKLKDR